MKLNEFTLSLLYSQRAIATACLILSGLIFVTLFYSIWQWRNDWQLAYQTPTITQALPTPNSTDILTAISENYIFGQPTKLGDMPITNLELRVTGIVSINSNQFHSGSKAFISISGQPSKIYKMGDKLPYGVKIYDITSDAVVIENNGRLEKLPLPREPLQFKSKK